MSNSVMNKGTIIVAPSILAADWGRLADEISAIESAGADWLHLDVMDGSFVPEISFGARFVEAVARHATVPLDVHLMIEAPQLHFERFVGAGADRITFHLEATAHSNLLVQNVQKLGALAGVAINPGTPVALVEPLLDSLDLLLLMTVNPGWGGQKFIANSLQKIQQARSLIETAARPIVLQVDGGIDSETAPSCVNAGATCLVAGSAVFSSPDYSRAIAALRPATA